jgi:hypothetical protein
MPKIIPIGSLPIFPEPTALSHSLTGHVAWEAKGPNHFHWEHGRLFHDVGLLPIDYAKRHEGIVPPLDLWNEVWKVCDEIGLWSWPPVMGPTDVCDGPGFWHTHLVLGPRYISTNGCLIDLPPDFKPKLLRFHRALQALTGWAGQAEEV